MPDRWAVATGNWSSTATWNGGTLPGTGDDVFADGFAVTINQDVTVLSIRTTQRTGGTAGGFFTCSTNRTITADVYAGTTNCLTISGTTNATVIGQIIGGSTASISALIQSSTGTVTVNGNCTGGSATTAYGARLNGAGTMNITGNCTGGNGGVGAQNTSSGTMNITGNCTSGGTAAGASNGIGSMNITGTCLGTATAIGASNTSTGTLRATRAKGHTGTGTVNSTRFGVVNSSTGLCEVEEIEYGDLGSSPTAGPISIKDLSTNKCLVYRVGLSPKTLVDPASVTIPRLSRGMDGGYLA